MKTSGRVRIRLVVEEDVRDMLDELARKKQSTFNHVANEALRKHVEWGSVYPEFGVVVSKTLLKGLFATAPEAIVREIGSRNGHEEGVAMVFRWRQKFDLESALEVFTKIFARYSGQFALDYSKEDDIIRVVLKHDLGPVASAYYAEYAKSLCKALGLSYHLTETEGQIVIKARREKVSAMREVGPLSG